jgi:hypothetical protein
VNEDQGQQDDRPDDEDVDPVMPGSANPSAHEPTSGPEVAPGYRRHTGPGGAPGAPGNAPASPLDETPVLYDEEDPQDDG